MAETPLAVGALQTAIGVKTEGDGVGFREGWRPPPS